MYLLVETYESNFSSPSNLFIKVHRSVILFQQIVTLHFFICWGTGKRHAFLFYWNCLLTKKMLVVWRNVSSCFCTLFINQFLADTINKQKFGILSKTWQWERQDYMFILDFHVLPLKSSQNIQVFHVKKRVSWSLDLGLGILV